MRTTAYARYAVFYAPPQGSALARIGAEWLGADPETGDGVAAPEPPGLPAPRARLTREARRYGLHATLKPPFRLADGIDPDTLCEAVAALAERTPPVRAPGLRVDFGLGFLSLRPLGPPDPEAEGEGGEKAPDPARQPVDPPALRALADACVTELDLLRAPLTGAETHRRRRAGLDMVEEAHLRNWGYPWVLDRFRFHITLTGPLASTEAAVAAPILQDLFAPGLEADFHIEEICVFGDPGDGATFRLLRRFPLQGVVVSEP
ncbi:MAG: DUF1045 domain-containing protein [Rubrimonas sp.]|uniref:DUF1045 domain-containing protein n=1 Tax=Rubrimonas sp. TaxID=2036015 RepID=UPI002FDC98C8